MESVGCNGTPNGKDSRQVGKEITDIPICANCLVDCDNENIGHPNVIQKALRRVDKEDGGLSRLRWQRRGELHHAPWRGSNSELPMSRPSVSSCVERCSIELTDYTCSTLHHASFQHPRDLTEQIAVRPCMIVLSRSTRSSTSRRVILSESQLSRPARPSRSLYGCKSPLRVRRGSDIHSHQNHDHDLYWMTIFPLQTIRKRRYHMIELRRLLSPVQQAQSSFTWFQPARLRPCCL